MADQYAGPTEVETLSVETTRDALAKAEAARGKLAGQVTELEGKLAESERALSEIRAMREAETYEAEVVGNRAALKRLADFTAAQRTAEDRITNLRGALKGAERRHWEAARAWHEANADYRFAESCLRKAKILALDVQIDSAFLGVAGMFRERERLLEELGGFDACHNNSGVMVRLKARISEMMLGRMFANLVVENGEYPEFRVAFPNVGDFRAYASTLMAMDEKTLELARPDAAAEWKAGLPTDIEGRVVGPDYDEEAAARRSRVLLGDERYMVSSIEADEKRRTDEAVKRAMGHARVTGRGVIVDGKKVVEAVPRDAELLRSTPRGESSAVMPSGDEE